MKNGIMQIAGVLALCVGLLLAMPTAAWAGGYTVYAPAPNGVDDTANLQRALDDCVRIGRDCTVQLAAGRYLTKQLVAYNFHGTLKGEGANRTTVEALPELTVNWPCEGRGWPDTSNCLWATLVMFVDGNVRVSDITFKVTAVPATKPYSIFGWVVTALLDPVRFMAKDRIDAIVENVAVEGREDTSDTSFWGFNLANGVTFTGEMRKSADLMDFYPFYGTLSVASSSFKNSASGVYPSLLKNGRITIGGSPGRGNLVQNVAAGVDLESVENSIVEVSYNVAEGRYASMWVVPWWGIPAAKPSLFVFHHNTLRPIGPSADGLFLQDDPASKWIYALIHDNKVEAQDIGYGGISAYNTKGTTLFNNKITGKGADGIGIWNGSYAAVLGNDVGGFTADPNAGLAQIVLDATTNYSTVVCKSPSDTVMDLGTGNKVIGCQAGAATAYSAKMSSRLSAPAVKPAVKSKPFHR